MARTTFRGRCPACGLDFIGEHGAHYGGPIALGYGVGAVSGLTTLGALATPFGLSDGVVWASVAAVVLSVLLTFRFCKAWWAWWLHATGEIGGGT